MRGGDVQSRDTNITTHTSSSSTISPSLINIFTAQCKFRLGAAAENQREWQALKTSATDNNIVMFRHSLDSQREASLRLLSHHAPHKELFVLSGGAKAAFHLMRDGCFNTSAHRALPKTLSTHLQ
jgi:hypothetical protein